MATKVVTNAKELSELAQKEVNAITLPAKITSQPTFTVAQGTLMKIKGIQKNNKTIKDSIVNPIKEALKNVKALFAPSEEALKEMENIIKEDKVKWSDKLEEIEAKRILEAEEKIKNGVDIEKATVALNNTKDNLKEVKTRKIPKVRILDKSKIPLEYLEPDEVKIKAVLQSGIKVEGAELYYEKIAIGA